MENRIQKHVAGQEAARTPVSLAGTLLLQRGLFPLGAQEQEQGNQGDPGQQEGQVDQTVKAPLLGEHASQAVAEQLTQAEENGIEAHEHTAIPGGLFGEVGQVRERGGREGGLGEEADEQTEYPASGEQGIAGFIMIQPGQTQTGQVDASDGGEHKKGTRHFIEEKGPEKQTEAKEQHNGAENQADMAAGAIGAQTAHEDLAGQMTARGEQEDEL